MNRKICKVRGCNKRYKAKGYCFIHYSQYYHKFIYYPFHKKYLIQHAKEYQAKNYIFKRHKCFIEECQINTLKKYCIRHQYRIKHNLSLELSIDMRHIKMRGKNNPNWHGGIAEYPNHYLMKKNRLIILMQNPKCEFCGKKATQIHHKDGNKANHKLSNLAASCRRCNSRIRFKPNNSKFRRIYGMNLQEIAVNFGRSDSYWWNHQKELTNLLKKKS